MDNVDNYVDKMLITFQNLVLSKSQKSNFLIIPGFIIPDWTTATDHRRYMNFGCYDKLQKCTKSKLYEKYTIILYYYGMFVPNKCSYRWAGVYIFRTNVRLSKGHISSIHTFITSVMTSKKH